MKEKILDSRADRGIILELLELKSPNLRASFSGGNYAPISYNNPWWKKEDAIHFYDWKLLVEEDYPVNKIAQKSDPFALPYWTNKVDRLEKEIAHLKAQLGEEKNSADFWKQKFTDLNGDLFEIFKRFNTI